MPSLTFPDDDQITALVAALTLPASEDGENSDVTVRVEKFKSVEALSQLYCYELQFCSATFFTPADLVGVPASVGLRARIAADEDVRSRYFHGVVNRVSYVGEIDDPDPANPNGQVSRYVAQIVPSLWFLTQTHRCRIFQDMTIPDIVAAVFDDHNVDSTQNLDATYACETFRVQYRESDFAFVSRLLEEAGIYYYFQHTDPGVQLVLSDRLAGWFESDEPVMAYGGSSSHIHTWQHDYQYRPVSYGHRDFNFEQPADPRSEEVSSLLEFPQAPSGRIYDYPGGFLDNQAGDVVARVRMEELESSGETNSGRNEFLAVSGAGCDIQIVASSERPLKRGLTLLSER